MTFTPEDWLKLLAAAVVAAIGSFFTFMAGQRAGRAADINALAAANGGLIGSLQNELRRVSKRQDELADQLDASHADRAKLHQQVDACEAKHHQCERDMAELHARLDALTTEGKADA